MFGKGDAEQPGVKIFIILCVKWITVLGGVSRRGGMYFFVGDISIDRWQKVKGFSSNWGDSYWDAVAKTPLPNSVKLTEFSFNLTPSCIDSKWGTPKTFYMWVIPIRSSVRALDCEVSALMRVFCLLDWNIWLWWFWQMFKKSHVPCK